jgi:hypothetical protein
MLSLSKLFIARTLLCAMIIMLGAPAQTARNSSAPSTPTVGNPNPFITCQPGFVFRCTSKGCFCVPA